MKTSVCIASLCLGVLTSGAFAADVNVRGALSETLDGSDNYFLSNSPTGTTFKSLSAFNLDVLARTPGWRYLLSSNVSYYNYFGDGADATSPTQGTPINETFRIDHATDLARYYFTTTWNRADIASTQLRESGVVTGSGTLDTVRAGGGGPTISTGSIPFPGRRRPRTRASLIRPRRRSATTAHSCPGIIARSAHEPYNLGDFRLVRRQRSGRIARDCSGRS